MSRRSAEKVLVIHLVAFNIKKTGTDRPSLRICQKPLVMFRAGSCFYSFLRGEATPAAVWTPDGKDLLRNAAADGLTRPALVSLGYCSTCAPWRNNRASLCVLVPVVGGLACWWQLQMSGRCWAPDDTESQRANAFRVVWENHLCITGRDWTNDIKPLLTTDEVLLTDLIATNPARRQIEHWTYEIRCNKIFIY